MLQGVDVATEDLIRLRGRARRITLRGLQANLMPGARRSAVFGRGMDYEESRRYAAGDDARLIDWRVTARTRTAHTKVFREDRQRAVFIVADLTESMRFGTKTAFKSVVAAEAAALLAWAAHDQGDHVAIVPVTGAVLAPVRPTRRTDGLHRQLDALAKAVSAEPDSRLQLTVADAAEVIDKRARTGDLAVFLSDFFAVSSARQSQFSLLKRRLELIGCWIVDSTERVALPPGSYPISDGRQFSTLQLYSRAQTARLQNLLTERCEQTRRMLRTAGMPAIRLQPGDDPAAAIAAALQRSRRLGTVRRQAK